MILAVDIGNTHTVWGFFNSTGMLVNKQRSETKKHVSHREFTQQIKKIFKQGFQKKVNRVLISSVVPDNNVGIEKALRPFSQAKPCILDVTNIPVAIRYSPREAVGCDRLVSAYAVIQQYPLPAVVVDLGTATTFNAISFEGEYLGGAIAPGLGTGAQALFKKAARLHEIPLEYSTVLIGTNLKDSLNAGIVFGHWLMVKSMIKRFQGQFNSPASIIVTGGWSNLLKAYFPASYIVDSDLTLRGIYFLHSVI